MPVLFHLFGPIHLAILASIPALAALFTFASRHRPSARCSIRCCLGGFLALNELTWYVYRLHFEGFRFPEGLPLQLCDLTLWLTVVALFTLRPLVFEVAYFAGIGGSGMALLTPDLWAPLNSYPTVYFFLAHGLVVAGILLLLWTKQATVRPVFPWRVFAALNAYAAAIGLFNAIFKTNYLYLCAKPASASVMDVLGPWPVYIFGCEGVALIVFWLLWLPFRQRRGKPNAS